MQCTCLFLQTISTTVYVEHSTVGKKVGLRTQADKPNKIIIIIQLDSSYRVYVHSFHSSMQERTIDYPI